jgi:hypothetical protein
MTMLGILEVVFKLSVREYKLDRLLFEKSRGEYAILKKNCLLASKYDLEQMRIGKTLRYVDILTL